MCDDFERLLRSQTSRVTSLQGEAETKEGHHARVDKENDGRRQALRKIAECIAERKSEHAERNAETDEWRQQCEAFDTARANDVADYNRMMTERRELKQAIDEYGSSERGPRQELNDCNAQLDRAKAHLREALADDKQAGATLDEVDCETNRLMMERMALLHSLEASHGSSTNEYDAEVARGEWLLRQISTVRSIINGEQDKSKVREELGVDLRGADRRSLRVSLAGAESLLGKVPRHLVLDQHGSGFHNPGGDFKYRKGRKAVGTPKVKHLFRRGKVRCEELRLHTQGGKKEHTLVKGKVVKSITGKGASVTFYDAEHRCVDSGMVMFSKRNGRKVEPSRKKKSHRASSITNV